MRKRTIAEMRARSLEDFNANYIHDMEKARKIINIYYRLAALSAKNLENDTAENQSRMWYQADCEKETRMWDRLSAMLKPYGLKLHTPWICPTIVKVVNEAGGVADAYNAHFYR